MNARLVDAEVAARLARTADEYRRDAARLLAEHGAPADGTVPELRAWLLEAWGDDVVPFGTVREATQMLSTAAALLQLAVADGRTGESRYRPEHSDSEET